MSKKIIWTAIILSTIFIACKKNFEEINTNPNSPSEVNPSLLLRKVIYDYGEAMAYEGFVAGNLLGQNFTAIDFNLFDRHSLSQPQFGGNPWPIIYSNLRDNEIMIERANSNLVFEVYKGPGLILKAYMAAALTDIYGDVPYFESLKGTQGNVQPKYDDQASIYKNENGILDNLNKGIAAIENYKGIQSLEGDILFNGDLNSWVKFANSLKIKYLLRISGKENVAADLEQIYSSNNFMSKNSENASFDFTNGAPNNFRMARLRAGDFNLFIMSETSEEILKGLNDPRINVFFRPIGKDTSNSVFKGLLNGPDASKTSISVADYSLTGRVFREQTSLLKANFLTAMETQFNLAEAAEKGWISGSAKTHYENGVKLAFEYWNTALPSTYLTTDSAAFGANGSDRMKQIITQKWIANTINGYEGWIEYRRTGFPVLKTVSASLNSNLIPTKMPYPADEASLNTLNFNFITGAGGNDINKRVWWDVN